MKHTIIGFGISGMILFLELMKSKTDCLSICVFDPNWSGGDLTVKYRNVMSNTPWSKTKEVLSNYDFAQAGINYGDSLYKLDSLMRVSDMAQALLLVCEPFLKKVKLVTGSVQKVFEKEDGWSVCTDTENVLSENVYLCLGAEPKTMDINIPIIPLEVGLDPKRLSNFVMEGQNIAVIGCSHSGLIAMRNLKNVGANVTGIYRGNTPFVYARDGVYNGIKGEITGFADDVKNDLYDNVDLVCCNDFLSLYKILTRSDAAIIATGFKRRTFEMCAADGSEIDVGNYDTKTGLIDSRRGLYGFGIAYPGTTTINNIVYEDVGLLLFQQQIQRGMPNNL
jgi:hypothetical protein